MAKSHYSADRRREAAARALYDRAIEALNLLGAEIVVRGIAASEIPVGAEFHTSINPSNDKGKLTAMGYSVELHYEGKR